MNTPDIYTVGPHAYKVALGSDGRITLTYRLWHANGWMEQREARTPGKGDGKPNAQPWTRSRHTWKQPRKAHEYARHLLREQGEDNDDETPDPTHP